MNQIYVKPNGTTPWNADQSMGMHLLTQVAPGIDDADAVNLDQLIDLASTYSNRPTAIAFNLAAGAQLAFYSPTESIPCKLLFKTTYQGLIAAFEAVFSPTGHNTYAVCGDYPPIEFTTAGTAALPIITAVNNGTSALNVAYILVPI